MTVSELINSVGNMDVNDFVAIITQLQQQQMIGPLHVENPRVEFQDSVREVLIIPKNATNGDVIEALFPSTHLRHVSYERGDDHDEISLDNVYTQIIDSNWRNSKYKKGNSNDN